MAELKFQWKLVERLSADPVAVTREFNQPSGWSSLGAVGNERRNAAWSNPLPGTTFFLTLDRMCSYRLTLVGCCEEGMTFTRLKREEELRLLVKPIQNAPRTFEVEVEEIKNKKGWVQIKFYNLAGVFVLAMDKKKVTQWRVVTTEAKKSLGMTRHDWAEFMLDGQQISKFHWTKVVMSEMPSPKSEHGPKVKKDNLKDKFLSETPPKDSVEDEKEKK